MLQAFIYYSPFKFLSLSFIDLSSFCYEMLRNLFRLTLLYLITLTLCDYFFSSLESKRKMSFEGKLSTSWKRSFSVENVLSFGVFEFVDSQLFLAWKLYAQQ